MYYLISVENLCIDTNKIALATDRINREQEITDFFGAVGEEWRFLI